MINDTTTPEGAPARPDPTDPIILLIRRHERAEAAADEAYASNTIDEIRQGANSAAWRALWGLVETRPTTIAGIVALCDHLAKYEGATRLVSGCNDYDAEQNRQFMTVLLRNISAALTEIKRGG